GVNLVSVDAGFDTRGQRWKVHCDEGVVEKFQVMFVLVKCHVVSDIKWPEAGLDKGDCTGCALSPDDDAGFVPIRFLRVALDAVCTIGRKFAVCATISLW